MNPAVDFYFNKTKKWQAEISKLRTIVLKCGLAEELKWGCPCYTMENKNIVLIHTFKEYCAILFFKGALLKDPTGILVRQTENVQSARQARFTSAREIVVRQATLKALIYQAIEVEKAGLKVSTKKAAALKFPEEFQTVLNNDAAVKTAFAALTPGRQRAYNLYFSAPKQSKTRQSRVEKSLPGILAGKGLNE